MEMTRATAGPEKILTTMKEVATIKQGNNTPSEFAEIGSTLEAAAEILYGILMRRLPYPGKSKSNHKSNHKSNGNISFRIRRVPINRSAKFGPELFIIIRSPGNVFLLPSLLPRTVSSFVPVQRQQQQPVTTPIHRSSQASIFVLVSNSPIDI